MVLTAEQQAVTGSGARDIAVSAGAGTGKTRVLVERFIGLLRASRIPEIVAVTFTEAAATEMRNRVRAVVMARDDLRDHRDDLDSAVIGTIHGLCLEILRRYPVEAGIDPRRRVLAEDESELLLLGAATEALEAAASDPERPGALALGELGIFQLRALLPQMLARRDDVEAALGAIPGDDLPAWREGVQDLLAGGQQGPLEAARAPVRRALDWLTDRRQPAADDALSRQLDELLPRLGDPLAGDWQDWGERLAAARSLRVAGGSKGAWSADPAEVRDQLRAIREAAREIASLPAWNEHDDLALRVVWELGAIFRDACQRYGEAKRQQRALDFLDLEIEAVRLLRDHPRVVLDLRQGIRHLMVDEVQDTNPLQALLIELLIGDAAHPDSPHLFLVGDAKQSIYRFRGADVGQFNRLRAQIAGRGGDLLSLSRSFRAHDALVGRLNQIFTPLFRESGTAMEEMVGRGGDSPPGPHLTIREVAKKLVDGTTTVGGERRRTEADLVAGEIESLLAGRQTVWAADEQRYRELRPSDVAILLRRLANLHTFEQSLELRGIPYQTPRGAGFFTRPEVMDLTNLLGWLAEPEDEMALAGALRSPLFMVDDPTLLRLREGHRSIAAGLAAPPDPAAPSDSERHRRHAWRVLSRLRQEAGREPVAELLERALVESGVEAAWAPLAGGDQALANIRKLAAMARTLGEYSLAEFAAYLVGRRDEQEAREGLAGLDRSDAVQLMTVHAAKGLEFPVVFVPEAHLAARPRSEAISWRRREGISVTLSRERGQGARRRPGFYGYLAELDAEEEREEHGRLLYVAATRAADYLFVSGDEGGTGGWIESIRGGLPPAEARDGEVRWPAPRQVDREEPIGQPAAPPVAPPERARERDYRSPLMSRPPVIPLRMSTPVTALAPPREGAPAGGGRHQDGLGALRGSVAHRAIEESFALARQTPLPDLVRELAAQPLSGEVVSEVARDVQELLERFSGSELARTLRDPDTRAYFELPVASDWQGVPVHGTIDLAYLRAGRWHVVDFKSDRVRGRSAEERVSAYRPQLGLYGLALEQAVGQRPELALVFLRSGELVPLPWPEVERSLSEARRRIDAGEVRDLEALDSFEAAEMVESPAAL